MLSDSASPSTRGINDSIDARFAIACWIKSKQRERFGEMGITYIVVFQNGRQTSGHGFKRSENIRGFLHNIDDETCGCMQSRLPIRFVLLCCRRIDDVSRKFRRFVLIDVGNREVMVGNIGNGNVSVGKRRKVR